MILADKILNVVQHRSLLTERQIASELFIDAYQQRVNPTCRRLVMQGKLRRHGKGGVSDPYRYTT